MTAAARAARVLKAADPATALRNAAIAVIVLCLADLVAVSVLPRPITLKAPGELADVIPELQRFVEEARGRRFHKQVNIRRSDDLGSLSTGLDSLRQAADPAQAEAERKERDAAVNRAAVLRALGLVDAKYDPLAARRAIDNTVLGIYSPAKHELVVRTGPVTPRMRLTLVHELTHALDGEHHELRLSSRRERLVADESATSFRALAEGIAVHVEAKYLAAMSPEDRAAVDAANQAAVPTPSDIPDALRHIASYPYAAGRQFVESLIERDGMGAVDRAFEDPPTTSEHVLNPEKYLGDDDPKTVVKPIPRGKDVVQRGVFGELLLRLVVARSSGNDAARAVGAGWGGGRYVAWREGVSVCVAVHLVMDSDADTEELLGALRQWSSTKPRSSVRPGTPVAFENCVER